VNQSTADQTGSRLRPLTVLLAAAGGVTVLWILIVVFWRNAPFSLTFDDAFYYFGIARNVAHGHGSTFDGIDATNGYHPLWMLMAVPVYALGMDGTPAVRLLLVVQVICYGGALALIGWMAARLIDGWPRLWAKRPDDAGRAGTWCTAIVALALVAAAVDPFVAKVFVNGMESGVLVVLDAALLAVAVTWRGRMLTAGSSASRWATGLLLALIVLARTDAVFLLAVMGIWALAEARPLGREAVQPLVQLFALPAVTLVAYLVSNQVMFGIALQISGLTKRAPLTLGRVGWAVVALVVAGLIARWGYRRSATRRARTRFGRVAEFTASTSWFASFCVLVVAYYQAFQAQQWLWYYCPVMLYALCLLVIGVADFAESALVEAPTSSPAKALLPVSAILLLPLLAAIVFETSQFAAPDRYSIAVADRDAGEYIDGHLPRDVVLASWDAGALGYYAHRPVINLDGVANSYEYYQASRNGTVGDFLRARGVRGIVNIGTPVNGQDPQVIAFVRQELGSDTASHLGVVRTWPLTYSGTTTGSAGVQSGSRKLAVFLYEFPAAASTP
jgi:hypothetical protein